jgi:sugar lactone lactonase YvrE
MAASGLIAGGGMLFAPAAAEASPSTTTPSISIFAGNGTNVAPTPGPAIHSSIGNVEFGMAFDAHGNTYIADDNSDYVYKVTAGGTLSIFAGDGTDSAPTPGRATSSSIGDPEGLAFDKAGNLYIADDDNDYVYKVSPGGTLSIYAGTGSAGPVTAGPARSEPIGQLDGLAFDPAGNLYIVSYGNKQVYKVTPARALSVFAGVYRSDTTPTPGPATASSVGFPEGIATDQLGNVYIVDDDNSYVYKVTPGGTLSIFAGNGTDSTPTPGPAARSSLGDPEYVAIDSVGDVFITDDDNDLVYKVDLAGTLSIYAGIAGSHAKATPGPASSSAVGVPEAIAVNTAGDVFVSDVKNYFVYEITPVQGLWLATANGSVFPAGAAPSLQSTHFPSSDPVVGIAATPSGKGYWLVTRNGSVFPAGDARSYGTLPGLSVTVSDIVAIAPTGDGRGYWMIGADGGEFAFGDAHYHGSLPGLGIHVDDIVGMVATSDGGGYWIVGADGGVFAFGDTHYVGSLPGLHIKVSDIVAMIPSPTRGGYVLVGADGGAFVLGSGVHYYGSLPGEHIQVSDIVGLTLTPPTLGYWFAGADGFTYPFGDAKNLQVAPSVSGDLPVVGIAAS